MIRPQSADDPVLMPMLRYQAAQMVSILTAHDIDVPDGSVKIWLKPHRSGRLFPKIEFDACGQELQYDISPEGEIKEAHFKAFNTNAGPIVRQNIDKTDAHPVLRQIDDVLRQEYQNA